MASVVGKIFGMFDKIDDIVYEPIKLACDIVRQPFENHTYKLKSSHEQKLKQQLEQFEVDLEMDRKEREMHLSIEEQKLQAEIDEIARANDLAHREEMVQLEMRYRREMATAAVELSNVMANMQVETRGKILNLYTEKEKEYLDLQSRYKKEMFDTIKGLKEVFPDGTGDAIIQQEVQTQLKIIAERSQEFSKLMREDMVRVFGIIDNGMQEINGLATKYFQPARPEQNALTQNIVNSIEG